MVGLALLCAFTGTAHAWAPNTIVAVKNAIPNGTWDRFAIAGPSYHHTPWGGDWAVDLYGAPGKRVMFQVRELDPGATAGAPYGIVLGNYSSCSGPEWAGTAYQIGVYDGAGEYLGWVVYAHVETAGYGLLGIGSVVYDGTVLGTVEQFPYSSCYQVFTSDGVHTHIEMYNVADYACYIPHAAGTTLRRNRPIGGIGTYNGGPGEACY